MIKHCCLIISVSFFISSLALGQANIKGKVFENKTRIALADIQVQNLTTQQNTVTDTKGRFNIAAKTGDVLVFKGFAYNPDTLLLTNPNYLEVFLVLHQNLLNEVKVTSDTTENLNTYYDPMFHGQTVVYTRDANLNPTGGLTIRMWYWKKDERRRKRRQKELKEQAQQDEVNRVFRPANIVKYVPLKGGDMDNFLALYTPDIKVYNKPDFNLTSYLSDCYKKYLALPADKRHPDKLGE